MITYFLWLAVAIACFAVEVFWPTIFMWLPFSMGALVAVLASFWFALGYQLGCFLLASLIFLLIFRVFFNPARFLQKSHVAAQVIGKPAVVCKTITPTLTGQVVVGKRRFDAQSDAHEIILAGTVVKIIAVKGHNQVVVR